MNLYTGENNDDLAQDVDTDGENTMAVLSTLGGGGGGDDVLPEGEPLGLDDSTEQAKLSGSTLAVGVVVVLGALSLVGMKLTLGAIGVDTDPASAIAEIDGFIASHQSTGMDQNQADRSDQESKQVLEELKQNPTDHQIPAEKIATNPFDLSQIVKRQTTNKGGKPATPTADPRAVAIEQARRVASKFKVDMISGQIVYIDGEMYRIGDEIGKSGFKLESVDGLTCIIRTTDEHKLPFRLRYR